MDQQSPAAATIPAPTARLTSAEFAERVATAIRNGARCWLWPHVAVHEWQEALHEIERVTREVLLTGKANRPLKCEGEAVSVAGYTSGLGPLLGHWISNGQLNAARDTASLLTDHFTHNTLRMTRIAEHASRIVGCLADDGIRVTVLKGMHTAFTCFPAPGTRPLTDVDLFVDPADKHSAGRVLRQMGFSLESEITEPAEQSWRPCSSTQHPQSLSLVHADDPWVVDLHTSASRRPSTGANLIRFDDLITSTPSERWPPYPQASVLAPAAAVLFGACHAGSGFSNLRMLRLAELVMLIREAQQRVCWSWSEFLDLGRETDTLPMAYPALLLANEIAPGSIPDHILVSCRSHVPRKVLTLVAGLTPATAHNLFNCSMQERYLWVTSPQGMVKQMLCDILPLGPSRENVFLFYRVRAWKLLRGRLRFRTPSG